NLRLRPAGPHFERGHFRLSDFCPTRAGTRGRGSHSGYALCFGNNRIFTLQTARLRFRREEYTNKGGHQGYGKKYQDDWHRISLPLFGRRRLRGNCVTTSTIMYLLPTIP